MEEKSEIIYSDLNDMEKIIFNSIDFMLVNCKVNHGDKSVKRILSILKEKHK
jgi:hypothetical protein